jgi:hypothetical protein
MAKEKTKREQVEDLVEKLNDDDATPATDKMLYLAKVQTRLLADMVDLQVEVLRKLETLEINTG